MGLMTQYYKEQEAKLKKDRAEMEKRNQAHMEELAKQQPTPTPDELRRAMTKEVVEEKKPEPLKAKQMEAKPDDKAPYTTRDLKAPVTK